MNIVQRIARKNPELEKKLRVAHLETTPEEYIAKSLRATIVAVLVLGVTAFMLTLKMGGSIIVGLLAIGLIGVIIWNVVFRQADAIIYRRAKDIDREVLFAGRFLIVKLNSGRPLVNALVDASQSYGVANKYFKEIVRDIDMGTPLEKALQNAMYYSPSVKFRRILFQITTALKVGIDVTRNLEATLDEIQDEQLIEVQRYGKRLNAFTMFYMLIAVVMPSLGVTLLIIVASLVSLNITTTTFLLFTFFLLIFQLILLSIFRSIRPNVNI